ncbi:hypothetical protein [Sorangium sp. So ce388]|uniref:hypothetical protein n=1 Tax=Sorangium sp. So ce388 TaxID=3133309 RepID=UPI003F5B9EBF
MRLAAAEVFIAEGLAGTNWDAIELRSAAQEDSFVVAYEVGDGLVCVSVGAEDDPTRVAIDLEFLTDLPTDEAARVPAAIESAVRIARKVEAAMEEAARS